jgi:hypothetical protein
VQVQLPVAVVAHAACCGATFTLVLVKPSSSSSAAAAAAAASLKLVPGSPGFSLEKLQESGDIKGDRNRSGRCEIVTHANVFDFL